jgi:hypothetical protein
MVIAYVVLLPWGNSSPGAYEHPRGRWYPSTCSSGSVASRPSSANQQPRQHQPRLRCVA